MVCTDLALGSSAATDSVTWTLNDDVDVHTKDSDVGIVFLSWEISVVTNTEGKVALSVKVPRRDSVFSAVESVGKELLDDRLIAHGSFATDWCTNSNLQVTVLNATEGALRLDTGDHLKDIFSVDKAFSTFTNTNVHADLGHT